MDVMTDVMFVEALMAIRTSYVLIVATGATSINVLAIGKLYVPAAVFW